MSRRKTCQERSRSECESGWQAKFMNCRWDKAIGCHTGNNSPPIVEPIAKNKQTPLNKNDIKDKKYGPDIDDCTVPACKSTSNAFKAIVGGGSKSRLNKSLPCPLLKDELGRNTWGLLHTMAANFPNQPSKDEQSKAAAFINSMGRLYPCKHCAKDFQEDIVKNPPKVNSRIDFSIWMCEAHNRVNTKLGKTTFKCDINDLDVRWRNGGDKCE
jgi:hypothetical protein